MKFILTFIYPAFPDIVDRLLGIFLTLEAIVETGVIIDNNSESSKSVNFENY